MRKNFIRKRAKKVLDKMKKKANHQGKEQEEIRNLHAVIVERLVTHLTNAGTMEKENSMENATTATNMDTKLMNARKNQNLKVNATSAKGMVTKHQNADPNHSIQLRNL